MNEIKAYLNIRKKKKKKKKNTLIHCNCMIIVDVLITSVVYLMLPVNVDLCWRNNGNVSGYTIAS